ncbi:MULTISPECIES: phage integrase N-terminal SAM-like domain-containing protein [Nostoc]|uniref:Phage integrase N-terminal SAM-like domain-containing protein n=1 Tax=Nostoc paludosum FACHB-159 TaxID=2692908 RepID=A0ABR8KC61_9NOSO|nr:phage integrase N-terminal SAM-like domain-containing protein [Nostoc sp. FACHB-857]MBD2737134.1 phage integrase N-terminal SAM-like domain-containing protein [Nostoc paludosum FACHB-159]
MRRLNRNFLNLIWNKAQKIKHYSYKTKKSYIGWIVRYIFLHHQRQSKDIKSVEIKVLLTDLAVSKQVATSIQNPP